MAIPLDPGAGGMSIDFSALQNADFIVSTQGGATSAVIRLGTLSHVSHVALYVGYGQIVEAIGKGVSLNQLSDALMDDRLAVAYRYPDLDATDALKIRDFVGLQLDKGYNYAAIASQACLITGLIVCIGADLVARKQDRFICSQLVLAAYESVGIKLTKTRLTKSRPGDIPHLQLKGTLNYVGHLKA